MKPRVYVETSVVSYLTARPSRDLVMAAHQEVTRQWWQGRSGEFELFYSEAVLAEAALGDTQAAAARLAILSELVLLEIPPQAMGLAQALVQATALPEKARVDALHIAVAACEGMDFVLTWNSNILLTRNLRLKCGKCASPMGYCAPCFAPRWS